MYNFTYENQGNSSYLVYTLAEEEMTDSMSLGMITNNKIPGLASAMFMQMNSVRYMKYNISSKIPVSRFFSGPVSRKRLLGVFSGITDAMLSAEEYMLDIQTIILDPDYIFADTASCETVLICLPVDSREREKTDLNLFFKNIMFGTQFDQTENCDHVTKIINYLNDSRRFSLTDFKALLEEIRKKPKADPLSVKVQTDSRMPLRPEPEETAGSGQIQALTSPAASVAAPAAVSPAAPPAAPVAVPAPPAQEASEDSNGKKMSLYYLLRHYDKENAGIYKAQKAEKKQDKASRKTSKKSEKKTKNVPVNIPPMDIPGKPVSAPPQASHITEQEKPPAAAPYPPAAPCRPAVSQIPVSAGMTSAGADFGDTVYEDVQEGGSETVLMGQNTPGQQIRPHLIRKRNNEVIPVNKSVFRLGRNYEYNDYMIAENEFVGNSHCHILTRDGEYFIVDDNSKNHTYVNGVMIPPGTEVKLIHGQVFRLADEEFEFRLF